MSYYNYRLKTSYLVVCLTVLMPLTGCTEPINPANRTGPNNSTVGHPGFVYPENPPLINRSSLAGLLRQLACRQTILWVISEIDEQTPILASDLSTDRDQLRLANVRVIGLYAGSPRNWNSKLLPMLRSAGANFICTVIEPPARAGIANWLNQKTQQMQSGLYLIDESQHIIAQLPPLPNNAKSLVADLTESKHPSIATQPASNIIIQARIRLISLADGRIIASIAADAPNFEILTEDIARELSRQIKPTGTVAVLPIRRLGDPHPQSASLGTALPAYLTGHGWPSVVGADKTNKMLSKLDLSAMAIEFDPLRLANHVSWEAVIAGTVTCSSSSTNNPKPTAHLTLMDAKTE
ncbi:MAG: hypothetical protein JSV03_00075 [Planctomycetota bacterium]|nr:MAG: hypothetical protein JSV03_00075 [Planctomycetota bacterium]